MNTKLTQKLKELQTLAKQGRGVLMGLDRRDWCGEIDALLDELIPLLENQAQSGIPSLETIQRWFRDV